MTALTKLWTQLTEPAASTKEPGRRQQARLLAALLLCLIPLSILSGIVTRLTVPFQSSMSVILLPMGVGAAAVLAIAYWLNRVGRQQVAALLAIAVINLGVYTLLINGLQVRIYDPGLQAEFLVYVMLPVLLASVLLPLRRVAVVIALNLGVILMLPVFFPKMTHRNIAFGPLSFILIASSLVLVAGWYQRRIEQERRADLAEKEERYRGLLETAFEGVAIYAAETLVDANEGLARMAGYARAEMIGMPVLSLVAEEARDQLFRDIQAGGEQIYETLGLRKDGTTYYAEVILKTHEYQGRTVQIAAVRDVSDRKQAEEALRQSEERYRVLVEASPDGIVLTDLDGTIIAVNKQALKLCGCDSPEALLGKSGPELLAPEEREVGQKNIQAFLRGGEVGRDEYTLIREDGTSYPAEVSAALLLDAHDEPYAILNVVRDITERRKMEQALHQYSRELEMLNLAGHALNASLNLDEVLVKTLEWACKLENATACSVWLLDPQTGDLVCHTARGPHQEAVEDWRLAPGQGVAGWVSQADESLIVADTQTEARHFQGIEQETGLVLRSLLAVPLQIKGEVIGVLEVLDLAVGRFTTTDQTLLEALMTSAAIALENARLYASLQQRMRDLQLAQTRLVQSSRMAAIGELAAGVAHELNNPLMGVLGYTELLLEHTPAGHPDRRRLEAIFRQAGRVRDIVRNLMSFSQQSVFHREPANLNHVVQKAVALIRLRLKTAGIVLEEHYAPDLPSLLLDAGRMQQVVLNLLTNALDAMPEGGRLTVRTEPDSQGVRLRITDTGVGIPDALRARIFEPFFSTRPVGEGTGLGLAVSLGIVQEHGGHIEVESTVGAGSTFTISLPVEPLPQAG
jgi:PAS domain S-box-containing protein